MSTFRIGLRFPAYVALLVFVSSCSTGTAAPTAPPVDLQATVVAQKSQNATQQQQIAGLQATVVAQQTQSAVQPTGQSGISPTFIPTSTTTVVNTPTIAQTNTPSPTQAQLLIGKWQSIGGNAGVNTVEFLSDGKVLAQTSSASSTGGTYKLLDDHILQLQFDQIVTYAFQITGNRLEFCDPLVKPPTVAPVGTQVPPQKAPVCSTVTYEFQRASGSQTSVPVPSLQATIAAQAIQIAALQTAVVAAQQTGSLAPTPVSQAVAAPVTNGSATALASSFFHALVDGNVPLATSMVPSVISQSWLNPQLLPAVSAAFASCRQSTIHIETNVGGPIYYAKFSPPCGDLRTLSIAQVGAGTSGDNGKPWTFCYTGITATNDGLKITGAMPWFLVSCEN